MTNIFLKAINRYKLIVLFIASIIVCLSLGNVYHQERANAQTPAAELVNKGIISYQKGAFRTAIPPWQSAIDLYKKNNDWHNIAIINENLARAYQQLGETATTLNYWEKVIAYYRSQQNLQKVGRILTEMAQVYSNSGQTKKAINILCGVSDTLTCQPETALQIARQQKDISGEIAALGSLGEAYRLQGNYEVAIKYLETAKANQNQTHNFALLNSLGNAHASRAQLWQLRAKSAQQQEIPQADTFQKQTQDDYLKAIKYFQGSLKGARQQNNQAGELQSRLNLIRLAYRLQNNDLLNVIEFNQNIQQAVELIDKLPDTVMKVYAAIDLANLPATGVEYTSSFTQCFSQHQLPDTQITTLFNTATKVAKTLQNSRAESYALGSIGHFYECQQKYQTALDLTNKAILFADQNLQSKDSLYLWEWQAGRILQKQKKIKDALPFYQRSYNTLEKLRSDILITNRDFQFDFRDVVEPVYRELAQMQLELSTSNSIDTTTRKQQLNSALTTINSLRLAEIQNYFGNDCIIAAFNQNNNSQLLADDTAVISSIVLADKTGILLTLPHQEQHLHWLDKSRENLRAAIADFRNGLLDSSTLNYSTTTAGSLYELIISPLEEYLAAQKIKTLVFIQDSFLRDIPMAALYNQKTQQYLIQKYAIGTTSSLQLTNLNPGNLKSNRTLILAVSRETKVDEQIFEELENVPLEVQAIKQIYPNSKKLQNEDFSIEKLKQQIQNIDYPIIHIATHAQFGVIPEDTFIVTGNSEKLTINQLEILLRESKNFANSRELLTLTACETATGDERTALGLAGVALQAGTKSALASLWSVNDESTTHLVTEFYNQLRNSGMSKAAALQAAQLKLINAKQISDVNDKYDHPYYWSAFILIGNWL